jgi:hypothetical protein
MSIPARDSVVVRFPAPARPVANRLSMRDRIEALSWADDIRQFGYTRIVFDTSAQELDPELGDFLLVYRRDAKWATWGVGCVEDRFMLWRPATGATVGWFPTLRDALDNILAMS